MSSSQKLWKTVWKSPTSARDRRVFPHVRTVCTMLVRPRRVERHIIPIRSWTLLQVDHEIRAARALGEHDTVRLHALHVERAERVSLAHELHVVAVREHGRRVL